MRNVPLRRVKKTDPEEILHFSLQGLLSPGHTLALNTTLGTLSELCVNHDRPLLMQQQQFSNSEISVLLPLLESFPYFCPFDVLLANFTYGKMTETTIERCRKHLQEAQQEGMWEQEMRPMRNVLSKARFKTRAFCIDIAAILENGYILMALAENKRTPD